MEKRIKTRRLSEERWDVSWTEKFFHFPETDGCGGGGGFQVLYTRLISEKKTPKKKNTRTHSEWLCELIIT